MKVQNMLRMPWALVEQDLIRITDVYSRWRAGEKIDVSVFEPDSDSRAKSGGRYVDVAGSTAVVRIEGIIAPKINLLTNISGGTSLSAVRDELDSILLAGGIERVVLAIDSPGGSVQGVVQFAEYISKLQLPVFAYCEYACSAAYWIAAQADKVYAADRLTEVGSIGVYVQHVDQSEADRAEGLVYTLLRAGTHKALADSHQPLTDDARAALQAQIDHVYGCFVSSVAGARGLSAPPEQWAEGKVFFAEAAIELGLVDGIAGLDEIINMDTKRTVMDRQQLETEHPDLYAQVVAAARAEGAAEAVAAERRRREAILALEVPVQCEHRKMQLALDGESTVELAAVELLRTASEAALGVKQERMPERESRQAVELNAPVEAVFDGGDSKMSVDQFRALSPASQMRAVLDGVNINDRG